MIYSELGYIFKLNLIIVYKYQNKLYLYIRFKTNNMKTQLTQDLLAAKKGLTYTNEALASALENWERKEFEAVKSDLEAEIASLENRLTTCF